MSACVIVVVRGVLLLPVQSYARYAPTGDDVPLRCWLHDHGLVDDIGKPIPMLKYRRRPVDAYEAPPMPWGSRGVEFRGGLEGDVGCAYLADALDFAPMRLQL